MASGGREGHRVGLSELLDVPVRPVQPRARRFVRALPGGHLQLRRRERVPGVPGGTVLPGPDAVAEPNPPPDAGADHQARTRFTGQPGEHEGSAIAIRTVDFYFVLLFILPNDVPERNWS